MKITSWTEFSAKDCRSGGLRSCVAWLLRKLADRIDGMHSVGYVIKASHGLTDEVRGQIVQVGAAHSHRVLDALVDAEVADEAVRQVLPELYEE